MNIPVCDTEDTDILRYFNDSYKFINKARKDGKNVLVHCKMGISRSATIVIGKLVGQLIIIVGPIAQKITYLYSLSLGSCHLCERQY